MRTQIALLERGVSETNIYMDKQFGITNHYYIANPKLKNYVIAEKPIMRLDTVSREDVELKILEEIPEITNTFYPDKSRDYI